MKITFAHKHCERIFQDVHCNNTKETKTVNKLDNFRSHLVNKQIINRHGRRHQIYVLLLYHSAICEK